MAKQAKNINRRYRSVAKLKQVLSESSHRRTAHRSKKDLVLSMLHAEGGTSILAITEATGWQPHSIRAFFAKEVRKRQSLNLKSELIDGERVYRIALEA